MFDPLPIAGLPKVTGYLIGRKPNADSSAKKKKLLMSKIDKAGSSEQWQVIDLSELLGNAKKVHLESISALEAEEAELQEA